MTAMKTPDAAQTPSIRDRYYALPSCADVGDYTDLLIESMSEAAALRANLAAAEAALITSKGNASFQLQRAEAAEAARVAAIRKCMEIVHRIGYRDLVLEEMRAAFPDETKENDDAS